MRRARGRETAIRAGLVVLSVSLVLGAAEIGLRVYHRAKLRREEASRPPLHARAMVPSADPELVFEWNPGYREDGFSVNSHGMPDEELTLAKPPGVVRIAIVGDSISASFRLEPRETSYPALLEQRLDARAPPGVRFQTLNFAVNGYSALQSLRVARTRVPRFAPDRLLVQLCLNDPYPSSTPYTPSAHAYPMRLRGLLERRLRPDHFWGYFSVGRHYDAEGWANLRRAFEGFAAIHRDGLPTLAVLFPYFYADAYTEWGYGRLHTAYRELAAEAGLPFLDLFEPFAAAGLVDERGTTPERALHPDTAGHRLAAALIAPHLRNNGDVVARWEGRHGVAAVAPRWRPAERRRLALSRPVDGSR